MRLATALVLLLSAAVLHAQPDTQTHDTFAIQFDVFDNGFLGSSATYPGGGYVFGRENGLFEGQLVVATSATQVCGEAYAGQPGQESPNWVNTLPFHEITVFEPPFEDFTQGYEVAFDCSGDPNPLPITVTERSYSSIGSTYVVVEFEITNTGSTDLHDVYVGLFTDFNVGDFTSNLADVDEDTSVLYVWDTTSTSTSYYGVTSIISPECSFSGWAFTIAGANPTGAALYAGMRSNPIAPTSPDDRRTMVGTGPYTLRAGTSSRTVFAYVAGVDEASILASAQEASETVLLEPWLCPSVDTEPPADAPGLHLDLPFPNPARGRSTLRFTLDHPQPVRLAVYDALGREVAVLAAGYFAAGAHTIPWDASGLPGGIYSARLTAGAAHATRRIVLMR